MIAYLPCGCSHNGNSISRRCEPHQVLEIVKRHQAHYAQADDQEHAEEMGRVQSLIQGWIDSSFERAEADEEVGVEEDVCPL